MADLDRSRPSEPLFLERQTYRRRRLMDAARVLPILGAGFFLLPILWAGQGPEGDAGTATGGIYVFVIWLLLIGGAALISRRLIRNQDPPPGAASDEGGR